MNQSLGGYSQAEIEPVRNQLMSLNAELENESVRSMKIIQSQIEEMESIE